MKGANIMNDLETRKHGASRSSERQTSGYSAAALTPAVDVVEDGSSFCQRLVD